MRSILETEVQAVSGGYQDDFKNPEPFEPYYENQSPPGYYENDRLLCFPSLIQPGAWRCDPIPGLPATADPNGGAPSNDGGAPSNDGGGENENNDSGDESDGEGFA